MQQFFVKKKSSSTSRLVVTCLVISVIAFLAGVSVKIAGAAWQPPGGNPPAGGTSPLNVGNVTQRKVGSLQVATDSTATFMVGDSVANTKLGVDADNKKYGVDVRNATEFAGYFRGDVRVLDPDFQGGNPSDAHDDTVGIYSNASRSGVYVEQLNPNSDAGLTVSSEGNKGIQTSGAAIGISADGLDKAIEARAFSPALPTAKTYGIYGISGNTINPGNRSYAVYGEASGSGSGHRYGLYGANTVANSNTWAGFFEDTVQTNQPTVEINSRSVQYGLRVTGGDAATIFALGSSSGPGLYAEGGAASLFSGDTAGVYGKAGFINDPESVTSYGVYGLAQGGGIGVTGEAKSGGVGVYAVTEEANLTAFQAENKGKGYAARFEGLVDAGGGGFFLDGAAFLGNYVFAATNNGALAVGTTTLRDKITVEGGGNYRDDLSSSKIRLSDQNDNDDDVVVRYPVSVEYIDLEVPRVCIETPRIGGECSESTRVCESKGYVSIRKGNDAECRTACDRMDPSQAVCRWNCSGKIGYDDCASEGTGTKGVEVCTVHDNVTPYFYDPDSLAPADNCTCVFKGPGDDYSQAKYNGEYDKRCINFPEDPILPNQ